MNEKAIIADNNTQDAIDILNVFLNTLWVENVVDFHLSIIRSPSSLNSSSALLWN